MRGPCPRLLITLRRLPVLGTILLRSGRRSSLCPRWGPSPGYVLWLRFLVARSFFVIVVLLRFTVVIFWLVLLGSCLGWSGLFCLVLSGGRLFGSRSVVVVVPRSHPRACIVVIVDFQARRVRVGESAVDDSIGITLGCVRDAVFCAVEESEGAVDFGEVAAVLEDGGVEGLGCHEMEKQCTDEGLKIKYIRNCTTQGRCC